MVSIKSIITLATFAGAAVAKPHQHGRHHRLHRPHLSGSGPVGTGTGTGAPYPTANATGIWNSTSCAGAGPTFLSESLPVLSSASTVDAASTAEPLSAASTPSAFPTYTETPSAYPTHSNIAVSPVGSAHESITSANDQPVDTPCTTDITVTSTEKVTVTVIASHMSSAGPSSSAPAAQSSVAPVQSSAAPQSSTADAVSASSAAPVDSTSSADGQKYRGHRTKTTSTTPVQSVYSTPKSVASPTSMSSVIATKPTSSIVPTVSTSPVVVPTSSKTTLSSYSSTPSSGTTGSGKRGLAYNDASLTTCFSGSNQVSWAYNWGSSSSGLSSSFKYIPMLWGTSSDHTSSWNTNAKAAIASGSTHLMSFNEPDLPAQSNLTPQQAADGYRQWMMPFANSGVKLGAPSVTNGGGSMGLQWLHDFMQACSDCQIDFVNIHWYDSYSNIGYFKEHVQNATTISGGKNVFVSEFGCTNGGPDDISGFLKTVMPWMDSQSYIEGYSYFMAADGLLVSGTDKSAYGSTYATYTA